MITSTIIRSNNIMKQNLSFYDRQVRFVIGASAIMASLIYAPETMGVWSIALLGSVLLIATAITGWDPLYAVAGKSAYIEGEEDIQQRSWTCANLGSIDRVVRLAIGMVLLSMLLTMNVMQEGLVISLLAIPLIVTAIIAWDPFYALLNINSFASRIDVETAEPDASAETLGESYSFSVHSVQSVMPDTYRHAA